MRLLQTDRNANLLIDVLRSLVAEHRLKLHDFVIMPDHVHLLVEVASDMTIERAMQLIKGRSLIACPRSSATKVRSGREDSLKSR